MSIEERLRKLLGSHKLAKFNFVWDHWVLEIESTNDVCFFRGDTIEECLDKAEVGSKNEK